MKSRPILFSAPMVLANLRESAPKTQTRRVAKLTANGHVKEPGGHRRWHPADPDAVLACPYGQPGDQLWVREAHWMDRRDTTLAVMNVDGYVVAKNGRETGQESSPQELGLNHFWKLRPSIHMPRWASRITLEITGVRLERLQAISEADAIAEGIFRLNYGGQVSYQNYALTEEWAEVSPMLESPIASYRTLWEKLNGTASWTSNPLVWVVAFRRIK